MLLAFAWALWIQGALGIPKNQQINEDMRLQ